MNDSYQQILERFKEQNIDINNKDIIVNNSLNGEPIQGFTISEDKKWVCCPVYDDEMSSFIGEYQYKPQCFEIEDMYTTYLSNGYMNYLTHILVIRRP